MRLVFVGLSALLVALPALAERPADTLARMRGTPSTNAGALGSAFPQQYVDAYRYATPPPVYILAPPPRIVHGCGPGSTLRIGVDAGPVSIGGVYSSGGGVSSVHCPAPGHPTTIVTTTTTTTTVVTSGDTSRVLAAPAPAPEPRTRRVIAQAPTRQEP